ncbi:hypothetical protein [Emticicia sp. TH156]|uniref:hypothetical protein n=1 Tax=Emticicia sp. TH156 TaxID=2067454 RepID=UPI000C779DBF|nr:hypothetical protein [Emticicia sp. TH156]PLK42507.1 hypothetical protein C0V77_19955 [Emticicia sp. TH156]
MKKSVKNFALALVAGLFTISSVFATELPEGKTFDVGMYRVLNTMKINVMIAKEQGNWVEIRVKNAKNETIYVEVVNRKATQFAKKFNLEGLEDGAYRFEITNGKDTVVKEVSVQTNSPKPTDYRTVEVK